MHVHEVLSERGKSIMHRANHANSKYEQLCIYDFVEGWWLY